VVTGVKKKLVAFLLISIMTLSIAISVSANEAVVADAMNATTESFNTAVGQEIVPFTEMTRMYWRNHYGVLQWRLWSMTNGRWLSEWTTL
jgi:hypothetical protein